MRVLKHTQTGAFTIEGLDPDQFAYITGLLAGASAVVDAQGRVGEGPALIPTARVLYPAFAEAARAHHGLWASVDAVEQSQWAWQRSLTPPKTRRRRAA